VLRPAPKGQALRDAFRARFTRRVRHSDGTITLEGTRYEVPQAYRHFDRLCVLMARWDRSYVHLVDARSGQQLTRIFPLDRHRNADGERRSLQSTAPLPAPADAPVALPPLLARLLEDYQSLGLPAAYLPPPSAPARGEEHAP
jgi:hypothetical protein